MYHVSNLGNEVFLYSEKKKRYFFQENIMADRLCSQASSFACGSS